MNNAVTITVNGLLENFPPKILVAEKINLK
jgi:hypothetical protein